MQEAGLRTGCAEPTHGTRTTKFVNAEEKVREVPLPLTFSLISALRSQSPSSYVKLILGLAFFVFIGLLYLC
jgi:hypothetical protein